MNATDWAVIESETHTIPPDQSKSHSCMLAKYISKHRGENTVAVGCAIRKYVMMIELGEINNLAYALDETTHIANMKELTKTLVRKLIQSPPNYRNIAPELSKRLYWLLKKCLKQKLSERNSYAAVALNAILSLQILRSPQFNLAVKAVNKANVPWFYGLVLRKVYWIYDGAMP